MIHTEKIIGDWRKEFTKVFRQVKKDVSPYLDEYKMQDIDVRWWIKPNNALARPMGIAGRCYKGIWWMRMNGRKQHCYNLILLDKRLLEDEKELIDTWKHELVHLVRKSKGHDTLFSNLIRSCGAHRYHNFNKDKG